MARTFTEAEAQRVFARVAEKQRAAGTDVSGLSLEDLEEAARAAGLDARLVASAAAELDRPPPAKTLLGVPIETVRQRVVTGRVSDEAWEEMVAEARTEFGRTGSAGQLGRIREWTATSGTGNTQATTRLSLEPVGDDTRIVVTRSSRDVVFGFGLASAIQGVMAVLFGGLYAAGVDPELWIPALLLAVLAVSLFGGVLLGSRVWHGRQSRRAEALLNRLERVARAAQPDDRTEAPRVEPSLPDGRIDASLLDDDLSATDDLPTGTRLRT